jgi:hypothetical protein
MFALKEATRDELLATRALRWCHENPDRVGSLPLLGLGGDSRRKRGSVMRKKSGTYLTCITILSMLAGCSMTPQQTHYTAAGAAGGALVGGGIGCGIAASIDRDDPTSYAIGCPIGIGAGALIGAVIGYVMAPGPTPPPLRHRPLPLCHSHLRRRRRRR